MASPFITLCMPVYNGAPFLREAIESALAQSFGDFEIVVCDDRSTDDTPDIVAGYKDPRLTLYRFQENLGLAGNWNRAVVRSRGRFVKFLFQDDVLRANALSDFAQKASVEPDAGLFFCRNEQIDASGRSILHRRPLEGDRVFAPGELVAPLLFQGNFIGGPSNVMVPKDALEAVGLFQARLVFSLDLLMWILIARDRRVAYIDRELLSVRQHDRSATASLVRQKKTVQDNYDLYSELERALPDTEMVRRAKGAFLNRVRLDLVKATLKQLRIPWSDIKQYKLLRARYQAGA